MPQYKSKTGIEYEYISLPEILADGNFFKFSFNKPSNCVVNIAVADSLLQLLFPSKQNSPESIAYKLYPALRKYLENGLDSGLFEHWLSAFNRKAPKLEVFTEGRYEELINLIEVAQPTDKEKLQIYCAIAAHNVFSDRDIPLSIRILSDETGIPQNIIKEIAQASPEIFQVVSGDFVFPRELYNL